MELANDLIVNMTENFIYNGFVPREPSQCDLAMAALCSRTHTPHGNRTTECEACAGAHLHELESVCQATEVESFCSMPPSPRNVTRAFCYEQCLNRTDLGFARHCEFRESW